MGGIGLAGGIRPSPEVRSIHNSHEYSPTGMANSLPTPAPARTDIRFDGAGNLSDSSRPLLPGERYFGSERYSADRVDTVHDRFFKDFRESLLRFSKSSYFLIRRLTNRSHPQSFQRREI